MTKIAIVGAAPANKLDAPYGDRDWLIWTCSPKNEGELPRHNAWFEIHRFEDLPDFGPVYWEWLKVLPFVYMYDKHPEIRGSHPYPIAQVRAEFGDYFLTNTFAYMMAMAIRRAPRVIGLWGLSWTPEFIQQRPTILHFAQVARDRGIVVTAPDNMLAARPIYAFGKE